jgi:hypothetical protein
MSDKYENTIDFVIPLHRYHLMVRTVIEAIYIFYKPKNIYIITPLKYCDIITINSKKWNINNVISVPEEDFFSMNYNKNYNDIYDLFNKELNENSREFGWWYQQLIKLGAFLQIPNLSDPYIVWDSDLIPIKKWELYPTINEPFFKFAILQKESRNLWLYNQYSMSLKKIINLETTDPSEGTFVPHHYVFYHNVLNDLFNKIKEISGKNWIESIMDISHIFFRFSEYRTVSDFTKKYYPELLKYHEFNDYGKYGYRIREPSDFLNNMKTFIENNNIHDDIYNIHDDIHNDIYNVSYNNFIKYVNYIYEDKPSYLQIEHI